MCPDVIVEVGRWDGASASHLALGCKHNGKGHVYSVDINAGAGAKIPDELRKWITFVNADVFTLDGAKTTGGKPIDLLLEDGHHSLGMTEHVLRNFPARRVIVHDWIHWDTQKIVPVEGRRVLGEPDFVFKEPPTDCGYGVWFCDKAK
jgi:hypothetical protein